MTAHKYFIPIARLGTNDKNAVAGTQEIRIGQIILEFIINKGKLEDAQL